MSASVSPADVVTLQPFERIADAPDVLPPVAGEYAIRLLGAGGAILADYPIGVRFDPVDKPGALATLVLWVDGTQQVAIYHGSKLLASPR